MAICVRVVLAGGLAALALLVGCTPAENSVAPAAPATSPAAPGNATAPAPVDAGSADITTLAADDPCRLLTTAEVRGVFPGAKTGVRERTREKYGISACVWDTPTGKFALQLWTADANTLDDEIGGLSAGLIDPANSAARGNVRFETIAGVGEAAIAVVETRNEQKGILTDVAMLMSQRGTQILDVESTDLSHGDRAVALQALTNLATLADARM
jgi:hypothetical protein